uniref:Ground-like domain-containing protein n=1 Tax=Onchocerca volvulus TaxID=6282 RepID=A0A8R1Y050_ONCVO
MKQTTAWGNALCVLCNCHQPQIICPPPPPAVCPRVVCPPPRPPVCPPIYCPPPVVCPPPPVCPPVPFCHSQICPPCGTHTVPVAVVGCCKGCACSVRFKRDSSSVNGLMLKKNLLCNNDQLMTIMEKKIGTNATEAAFAIKKEADSELKAKFSVFCAMNDLIYVAHAESFCQHKKGDIICFAYKS